MTAPTHDSEKNSNDPFRETLQKILYGNLGAWKDAIAAKSPSDLKIFLMGELQRMEDAILDGVAYYRKVDAHKHTRKLIETNIEALALLKTVAELQEAAPTSKKSVSKSSSKTTTKGIVGVTR